MVIPLGSIFAADTCCCTRIFKKVHLVDTGHLLAVDSLLDSGATGMFIDVKYVRTQKLQTHPLPRAIPVYNIDGTPNKAGLIEKRLTSSAHLEITQNMPHIFDY